MPSDVTYNHETVALDGEFFSDCEFRDCRLVFAGGPAPTFENCRFDGNDWKFEGPAANTLAHLKAVWSAGGKAVVQGLIKEITGVTR